MNGQSSHFADPRPACGEEGVGPFAGTYCVLNEGHPRPPGHVYAPPGEDRIDHLDARLLIADEQWAKEANLRNRTAAELATAVRERSHNHDLYAAAVRERDEWKERHHKLEAAARALADIKLAGESEPFWEAFLALREALGLGEGK